MRQISYRNVIQTEGFWHDWVKRNNERTVKAVYRQFKDTGRIEALKLHWKDGDPNKPHIFYDSDIAKWIESAAYGLFYERDNDIEREIDQIVGLIEKGRDENGYFNSYFLQFEQDQRWQRRESHELYCAGHMLEAAIVYAEATAKTKLLELMTDYMDYIYQVFVEEKSAAFNTPGHQEIELALIKLYRYTGVRKYLDLAAYFIDTRGTSASQAEKPQELGFFPNYGPGYAQDQAPVAEQLDAQGHSVRFGYLFSAAADMARERDDTALFDACKRVLRDVIDRKMYITGGVGNLSHGESFGESYILPNKEAYTETCASISMAMVAIRMLTLEANGEYGDFLETQLYNGALAGISLSGDSFTYENPLEVIYKDVMFKQNVGAHVRPYERKEVFSCSCCPPNISRLLASIGGYQYTASDDTIYAHIYSSNRAEFELACGTVRVDQKTDYPWKGDIGFEIGCDKPLEFSVALRIPGWCREHTLRVNGAPLSLDVVSGYLYIERTWQDGDVLELTLQMGVSEWESHPLVAEDAGKVAIQVGPIVYCAEETDNDERLWDYVIGKNPEYTVEWRSELLGGVNVVTVPARRRSASFNTHGLYRSWSPEYDETMLTLIPYYAWCNREPGNMSVWLRKAIS